MTDEEITEAQKLLSRFDGVFCEPASAASIAGVIKYHSKNPIINNESIVSILTGHGLKDPNRAIEISPKPTLIESTKEALLEKIKGFL